MKALVTAILAGMAVAAGGAARAQTILTFSPGVNGQGVEVVATDGSNNQPFYVYAGRYVAEIGPANAQTQTNIFCVDYTNDINFGDSYTANTTEGITTPAGTLSGGYYNGGLASAMNSSDYKTTGALSNAARASEVAYLADTYLNATTMTFTGGASGSTDFNNNMAAVSLSIWDIVQDGGNGLGTGSVALWNPGSSSNYGYNTSEYSALTSLTSYYEGKAAANSSYQSGTADWLQAPRDSNDNHLQDYVMEVSGGLPGPHGLPAAPEPAGFVPLLLGAIGLGGLIVQRRRKIA